MTTIYQYADSGAATGAFIDQSEKEPIPQGWTHKAPSGVEGERFVAGLWQVVPAPPTPVPQVISSRQGAQQLIIAGLDEQVEAAIDAIEDPIDRKLTREWFNRAQTWERQSPELNRLGDKLELTEEQKDQLFIDADQL